MFENEQRLFLGQALNIGQEGSGVEEGSGTDVSVEGDTSFQEPNVETEEAATSQSEEAASDSGEDQDSDGGGGLPEGGPLPPPQAAVPEIDDATFEALAQQRGYAPAPQYQEPQNQTPPPWLEPLVAPMRDVSQHLRDMQAAQMQYQMAQQIERQRPQRPPENATPGEVAEYADRLADFKLASYQRNIQGEIGAMKNLLRQTSERLEQSSIQARNNAEFSLAQQEQARVLADPKFAWLGQKPDAMAAVHAVHNILKRGGQNVSLATVAMEMATAFGVVKTQSSANQMRRQASTENLKASRQVARDQNGKRPGPAAANARGGKPLDAKKQARILELAKVGALDADLRQLYKKQGFRLQ